MRHLIAIASVVAVVQGLAGRVPLAQKPTLFSRGSYFAQRAREDAARAVRRALFGDQLSPLQGRGPRPTPDRGREVAAGRCDGLAAWRASRADGQPPLHVPALLASLKGQPREAFDEKTWRDCTKVGALPFPAALWPPGTSVQHSRASRARAIETRDTSRVPSHCERSRITGSR